MRLPGQFPHPPQPAERRIQRNPIHLCPLSGEHRESLPRFKHYQPFVCRALFLTAPERVMRAQSGVAHQVSDRFGVKCDGDTLDHPSTRTIFMEHRKAQMPTRLQAAVKMNMAETKAAGKDKTEHVPARRGAEADVPAQDD